jgi:hypothetical protein
MVRRVLVKILSTGRIPFVSGTGPILKPIWLLEDEVNTLVKLGYDIQRVEIQPHTTPIETVQEVIFDAPVGDLVIHGVVNQTSALLGYESGSIEIPVDPSDVPEMHVVEVSVDAETSEQELSESVEQEEETLPAPVQEDEGEAVEEEEVQEEETVEEAPEVLVNDEDLSAEAFYTSEFLTKKKSSTILEARGIEFGGKETATDLAQKVLDSNPDVEVE